jgi:hypothetical protein
MTPADDRPVTAPPYIPPEPKNWTQHVDPRDRSFRVLKKLERECPFLFQRY